MDKSLHAGYWAGDLLPLARAHKLAADSRLRKKKMAERKNVDLGEPKGKTERDDSFWNWSVVLLKSTVQPQWLEMVHNTKRKPNYGMRGLNGIMEEPMRNKTELVGPVVDSYVKHTGNLIYSKLGRSKNTDRKSVV